MGIFFHSVTLDESKCVGCTNCIKRCPTEAIRVRSGKAVIMSERCIDCGECIRICPHHAKRAKHDHLSMLEKFTYKIALPAPSLYGQFNNLDDQDYVLSGLKKLGFDDVMEVSGAAELVSEATRRLMDAGTLQRPVISSACPAVVRLIRVRFPDLCDHVLPLLSPMETAARIAKQQAMQKTGLPKEQIGCFFITPCPAKVTDIRMPIGIEKSEVDGAIAISEIFPQLSSRMDKLTPKDLESLSNSGIIGVSWATSGGESSALLKEKYLAADGIENVIRVLEEIEDERIGELDFIELNACSGGCVGGVLCVENPYVAIARLQRLRKQNRPGGNALGQRAGVFQCFNAFGGYFPRHGNDDGDRQGGSGAAGARLRRVRCTELPCLCGGHRARKLPQGRLRVHPAQGDPPFCGFALKFRP